MGRSVGLIALSYLIANVYAQTGSGIIGFGISLYPDLCCQACHDSLSALYLNCTTFSSMDMSGMEGMSMSGMSMPMGTTSPECYASNKPWLQTMAYCIQKNCNAHGYPADKQAQCFSKQAVAGAPSPTFQESLPSVAPTTELASDAMWLNETSLVNQALYDSTYGTDGEFARSEYFHTRYSVALYLTVIGVCVICGAWAQLTSASPALYKKVQSLAFWAKLRQHVFLPALVGHRHLEPLPGQIGYVPSRTLSVFIAVYVVLNVVFSAVSFGSYQPNVFFLSMGFELCEYVGNRTGTLSLVNASIAILFAGRNNLLIALTGWSQTTFLTLHRWSARVATLQAIVHSIVYTMAYWEPGYAGYSAYAAKAAEPFYWWGIIATIAISLAVAFAVLPFRIRFYETFLAIHIVLVVLFLVGCWYHLVPHFGLVFGYQTWLYICFAYWAFERFARLVRLAFYNLGGSKAEVTAIPGSNVMQVKVHPRSITGFGPGQHSFLYFPASGKVWESHPFSVAGWRAAGSAAPNVSAPASPTDEINKKDAVVSLSEPRSQGAPSVTFLIRAHSGATAWLQRQLASSSTITTSVLTEGPYAGHRATHQSLLVADTVLCLIGGIGITSALGFIQQYANASAGEASGKTKRFVLAWSAREMSLIEHVRHNFLDNVPGLECSLYCTSTSSSDVSEQKTSLNGSDAAAAGVIMSRMDVGAVIRSHLETDHQTTVLVCGPGQMADEATMHVVNGVRDGFRVDLVEEAFTW
ncbi:ferric reductase like transmembrane component [Colletotrichum navitas]|uniref:Ferric reductase like transmembrane component n=1 Tax=Colletotrichum navitas TaxID=681940 RepID=A0AAD8PVZ7_9PEZI|nr:ferric reductase like transmembrane component [Colletotrichum navitas]KAK1585692.1 ferric reductase like transmembrane component [Colletotrichum navitas]